MLVQISDEYAFTLAKWSGWKPIGTSVNVKVDESSIPMIVGKEFIASVVAFEKNGAFLLRLATPFVHEGKPVHEVFAYPRHTGYEIHYMAFGAITVDLAIHPGNEIKHRFAIALIKRHK